MYYPDDHKNSDNQHDCAENAKTAPSSQNPYYQLQQPPPPPLEEGRLPKFHAWQQKHSNQFDTLTRWQKFQSIGCMSTILLFMCGLCNSVFAPIDSKAGQVVQITPVATATESQPIATPTPIPTPTPTI